MKQATVYIVDDEASVAESTAMLLESVDIPTAVFADAQAFLDAFDPDAPGCLLLDVRMPRMSGMALQQELNRRRATLPVIFVTGHGDVPMAVEAMRAGAVDFLQKPYNDEELIRRVQKALAQDAADREQLQRVAALQARYDSLTPREREVAQRLADGQANKAIALDLDISDRTVEQHRAHIMRKMEARALAHLVRMLTTLRQSSSGSPSSGTPSSGRP